MPDITSADADLIDSLRDEVAARTNAIARRIPGRHERLRFDGISHEVDRKMDQLTRELRCILAPDDIPF